MTVFAFAVGIATTNQRGTILDCFFPRPVRAPDAALEGAIRTLGGPPCQMLAPEQLGALAGHDQALALGPLMESDRPLVVVRLDADSPIAATPEAYLKLHLLSHRMALPNSLDLSGLFAHLPTVAWTTRGAVDPAECGDLQVRARLRGEHFWVRSVDKFPKMTDYVVPSGVRIADSSRIRLGAYLGEGTTVMPYGAINFNAGTTGPNMVEGRVSQGVMLGADSDLGGGASIMGTLSGGGQIVVSLGRNCLVGANGGTGIPLGDRCSIEAGLYITAGTVVGVVDERGESVKTVKARELAGGSDMLFIRNSRTGEVQCRTNRKAIALNDELHAHN
jgi:2,3,4,5-tetrahydropyridine-2-carboxylate N-succinyltransferase